jgi:hypothetical protein
MTAGLILLGATPPSAPAPTLTNISTVQHFKHTFNADVGLDACRLAGLPWIDVGAEA